MAISDLQGKKVFITGAASGIGAATARAFAEQGCELVLTDVDASGLEVTAASVNDTGVRSHSRILDVSNEEQFKRVAEDVRASIGVPHVLVNNAGIGVHGSFLNTPMDAVRRVFDINLYGVYNGCHAFLPMMLEEADDRHLVNIASLVSIAPAPNMSAYAATKYAVDGLTEVLAMELVDSHVDVTCVHPGIIDTTIAHGKSYNGDAGLEQERRIGEYYREHGTHPDVVARGIVGAVKTGREHLYIGHLAPLSEKLKRLSPSLNRKSSIKLARKIGSA
jgi:NAD(P)-dependent dehydrogenase (short-subunit alcohol dehydrogenase family)